MVKITVNAEVPDADLERFLDVVRKFDLANEGCHFHIVCDGGEHTTGEVVSILERVGIPLVYAERKP